MEESPCLTVKFGGQEQVRERSNFLCEYCHTSEKWQYVRFTVDHIIPVARGGAAFRFGWQNWLQGLEMAVKRLVGMVCHCQVSGLTIFVRNMFLTCGLLWRFPGHCHIISRLAVEQTVEWLRGMGEIQSTDYAD